MGNSASNASNPPSRTIRAPSPSPLPGNPHPSLRTKKKSLELPDLASLSLAQNNNTRGRQAKTASIPIPITPQSPFNHYQHAQRAPRHLPSTADVNLIVPPHQNHPPFPPAPRPNPSAPRGRQQPISARQQQQQVARMQELYNQSQQPANAPSRQNPFQQETVRSSIPVALTKANVLPLADAIVHQEYPQKEDLLADPVPIKVIWKGGGTEVVLARAGDEEWKGRQLMEKESTNVWTLTVMLRPGTHHVRFLVDGQWRVADDLPAAVDDQGSLANYVAVPIPAPAPAPAPPLPVTREKLVPGQSFWSADSSADGESERHHPQPQQQQQQTSSTHTTHSQSINWTNILPPELIEAAREEEAYLSASAGQYEVSSSNTRVTTGFVPAPNIPPAPGLPRHLEKLILNTRVVAGLPGAVAGGSSSGGGSGGGATGVRSGSGQG
ncbi:hypothetical protein BYT27DRAFT_6861705 [Phlegmacium glaucopus]|nr:hypothetical protein BYT27DRAFT_6861705 [Phlegmacium glaucopus]